MNARETWDRAVHDASEEYKNRMVKRKKVNVFNKMRIKKKNTYLMGKLI